MSCGDDGRNGWINVPPDKNGGCIAANTPLVQPNCDPEEVALVCSHVAGDGDDGGEALSSYSGSRVIVSLTLTENIVGERYYSPC
jgi:hypothetical protein